MGRRRRAGPRLHAALHRRLQDNDFLSVTFGYNGFGRLTGNETGSVGGGGGNSGGNWGATGLGRLFNSEIGGQISWLIPSALVLLAVGLFLRGRTPRTDLRRAAYVVWGGWLIVTALTFCFMAGIFHAYYTVALAPAVAALVGMGAVEAWERRHRPVATIALSAATAAASVWGFVLLTRTTATGPGCGSRPGDRPGRRLPTAGGQPAAPKVDPARHRRRHRGGSRRPDRLLADHRVDRAHRLDRRRPAPHRRRHGRTRRWRRMPRGQFGGPGAPAAPPAARAPRPRRHHGRNHRHPTRRRWRWRDGRAAQRLTPSTEVVAALSANAGDYTWVAATIGSQNAAGLQLGTQLPVMAIGGFNGSDPSPTLAQFEAYVKAGKIHYFLASSTGGGGQGGGSGTASQITQWVAASYTAGDARQPDVLRPDPADDLLTDPMTPVLDVVVPVYDEQATLAACVQRLHRHLTTTFPYPFRITVADNASTDATLSVARRLVDELPGVEVVHLDAKGRGRALKQVWLASDAPILAYMDVDLSTDLDALWPLVAPLMSGHSDLAIGTRLARQSRVVRGTKRELISRCYNLVLRGALGARFSDAQCGFKAIRADVAAEVLPLVEDPTWFFDTELLVLAERCNLRIHEVPVDWFDDPDSRVDILATVSEDLRGVFRMRRALAAGSLPVGDIARRIGRTRPSNGAGGQVVTFALVGVLSWMLQLSLFAGLRHTAGLSAQVANVVSLVLATLVNTWANRRWTFGIRGRSGWGRQQLSGLAIVAVTLALTSGALALLHAAVAAPPTWLETLAVGLATATATIAKFGVMRAVVFRPPVAAARAGSPADPFCSGEASADTLTGAPGGVA